MVSIIIRRCIVLGIDHQCIGCNPGANHACERIGQQRTTESLALERLIDGKTLYISTLFDNDMDFILNYTNVRST